MPNIYRKTSTGCCHGSVYGIFISPNDLLFFFTDIKPTCIVRSLEIFIMHSHSCEWNLYCYYYFMPYTTAAATTIGIATAVISLSIGNSASTWQNRRYVRIGIHQNVWREKNHNAEIERNISIKISTVETDERHSAIELSRANRNSIVLPSAINRVLEILSENDDNAHFYYYLSETCHKLHSLYISLALSLCLSLNVGITLCPHSMV